MRQLFLYTVVLGILSACTLTPLEQCRANASRSLFNVEESIRETQKNIALGYVFVPADNAIGATYCQSPVTGRMRLCLQPEDGQALFKRLRIEPQAEQAKLDVLLRRRDEILTARAQCDVAFPAGV